MQPHLDDTSRRLDRSSAASQATDGLTHDQLSRLAALLHDLQDEHRLRFMQNEEDFWSLTEDPSVDVAERQAARLAAEQDLLDIKEIDRSLAAIANGTYGVCATCGRLIPFERLEAIPTTHTCVACPDL